MGDFPQKWTWLRNLEEGGQGYTYLVKRSDGSDSAEYVLKRLKNPKREEYFEREIQACEKLDHPSVLKIIEHGKTPNGKPYLITPFCEGGSLERSERFQKPIDGLRCFLHICAGVAHAHDYGVFHLDIKPANIFLKDGTPVVGDFGICYIEDDQYVMTSEGPRGSMYYCAPELRGPRLTSVALLAPADVYSLGKVLYWVFSHEVYDGHQEDYGDAAERRLAELFPAFPEFAFVDELIAGMVRRNSRERVQTSARLLEWVQVTIDRIDAGGRVLDTTKRARCLYCGVGTYKVLAALPPIETRDDKSVPPYRSSDIYQHMRDRAEEKGYRATPGGMGSIGPLVLFCEYCGNVQEFRFDLAPDAVKNWRP